MTSHETSRNTYFTSFSSKSLILQHLREVQGIVKVSHGISVACNSKTTSEFLEGKLVKTTVSRESRPPRSCRADSTCAAQYAAITLGGTTSRVIRGCQT